MNKYDSILFYLKYRLFLEHPLLCMHARTQLIKQMRMSGLFSL